ncbi:MAG: winged helix-turn-helix transcriptional regulator [Methanobacteriota archaeon]
MGVRVVGRGFVAVLGVLIVASAAPPTASANSCLVSAVGRCLVWDPIDRCLVMLDTGECLVDPYDAPKEALGTARGFAKDARAEAEDAGSDASSHAAAVASAGASRVDGARSAAAEPRDVAVPAATVPSAEDARPPFEVPDLSLPPTEAPAAAEDALEAVRAAVPWPGSGPRVAGGVAVADATKEVVASFGAAWTPAPSAPSHGTGRADWSLAPGPFGIRGAGPAFAPLDPEDGFLPGLSREARLGLRIAIASALLLILPATGLYHRIRRDEVLSSATRHNVFGAVRARPGSTAAALATGLGKDYWTVLHHLDLLVQYDLVVRVRVGRTVAYFGASERLCEEAALRHAIAAAPKNRALLSAVAGEPGIPWRALAARLSRRRSALHRRVRILEDAGLLRRTSGGVWLTDAGRAALGGAP